MAIKISKKILLIAFFLISVVIFSFAIFQRSINRAVSESSSNFLNETAFLYAGTFKVKLNDQLLMLESQARYFSGVDMDDYNLVKQTIISTKGVGEFKRIAVANSSGMTINYDGKSSGNILMKDYFKMAMKGNAQISSKIQTDEDGEKVLTLAVPIFQQRKVVGVITGTFSYSILDNIFSVDTFGGSGYSFIIDKSGNVIIGGKSPNRLCFDENWTSFFKQNGALSKSQIDAISSDINSNLTNIFEYSIGSQDRIAVYTPIGLNDWYVLSVVTADYILSQQKRISMITVSLIVVMMAVFLIVSIILVRLLVSKARVERDNARYSINNENSQTLIFEYDFDSHVIEFSGNSRFIFGENIKSLPIDEFSKIDEKIHESERGLRQRLRDFIDSGETSYSSEIRFASSGGDYAWYKISGTLIRDKTDSTPIKFIGNLVNVNAQVIHEQELKTIAETDLLSGLLNKIFMEQKVSDFIAENAASVFGAFFIIDLDNFKQVNDKLGHTFGDEAICDTASKLSLVFSEKDFIGRIGGDEFCVFLNLRSSLTNPCEIVNEKAETMLQILKECYTDGEHSVTITPSIGISLFPEQAVTYKELFKRADIALYHVKNNGKNNFAIFNDKMKNVGESVYE